MAPPSAAVAAAPGITAAAGSVHEGRDDRDGEREGLELTRNTRLADVNEIKQQIRAATFETKTS